MNRVGADLLDKAMAMVETLCGDRLRQQTWGTTVEKRTMADSRLLFLRWQLRSLVLPRFGP